jgi:hypothetical protein
MRDAAMMRAAARVGEVFVRAWRALRSDERGEGVISAAIAVLVMAGIGALMWIGFRSMWETTETNTNDKVAEIGR